MFKIRVQKSTARLLMVALVPLLLEGCMTVGVDRLERVTTSTTAAIEVRIYDKPGDRKGDATTRRKVSTEIVRKDTGEKVFESEEGRWTKDDLPPGKYVLRLTKIGDDKGVLLPLASPKQKTFAVKGGETMRAEVVLKDTSKAVWTAVGVAAGIGLVALVVSALSHPIIGDIKLGRIDSRSPALRPTTSASHPEIEIGR